MHVKLRHLLASLSASICTLGAMTALPSLAAVLPIVSYSMENGQSGSQTYYDDNYGGLGATGNPNVSGSFLSGGLGQLTNAAFAAPADIFDDEWVGWNNIQPTITLDLGAAYSVNFVSVHASNWSPPFNDVGAPGAVSLSWSLDGVTYTPPTGYQSNAADLSGDEPRWVDLPIGAAARYVRFNLADGVKVAGTSPGYKPWIFLDEVRADGVPEPTTAALIAIGILALAVPNRPVSRR